MLSKTFMDKALFKIGISLHHLAQSIPKEHALFIEFIQAQSAKAATIHKDQVKYWAIDLNMLIEGFVTSKIFYGKNGLKNRFERTKEEREIMSTINAYKRSLKFELTKVSKIKLYTNEM